MFDFTKEYDSGFEPLNPGIYEARITKAEWKTSRAGSEYLNVGFETLESGRWVFEIFNLFHATEKVRNIAMGSMKGLLTAVGTDIEKMGKVSKELLIDAIADQEIKIRIKIQKDAEYGDKNKVLSYYPMERVKEITPDEIPF